MVCRCNCCNYWKCCTSTKLKGTGIDSESVFCFISRFMSLQAYETLTNAYTRLVVLTYTMVSMRHACLSEDMRRHTLLTRLKVINKTG